MHLDVDRSSYRQSNYRLVQLGHPVVAVLLYEALRTLLKLGVRLSTPPDKRRPELVILSACTQGDITGLFSNCFCVLVCINYKKKGKAIPVTGREGP
jgi:hypothetical protein